MENAKAERFRRVAAPRVQRVLDSLDNLSKCSNRNNYEYSVADISKMIRIIRSRLKSLEQSFDTREGMSKQDRFTF
jgi:hypothetical protein